MLEFGHAESSLHPPLPEHKMTNAAPRVIRLNPMDNIGVALADLEPASALPGGAAALDRKSVV